MGLLKVSGLSSKTGNITCFIVVVAMLTIAMQSEWQWPIILWDLTLKILIILFLGQEAQ